MRRILMAVAILLANLVIAQEIPLDSIVVEGRILPSTVNKVDENYEIITKAQIAEAPAQSVDELLAYYTSLDVRKRGIHGMQSDISLRGGTFEQVLLLINGVRMTDAQTAHNMMRIPVQLNDIDRIEIIKGPAARRYGANAFAGVINIITKPNRSNQIQLNAEGGSYGSYKVGFNANVGTGKWLHKLQANYGASDGYRYNTDYDKHKFWYQTSTKIAEGDFNFQAGFGEWNFGANGFYATPSAIDQYEEVQSSIVSANYSKEYEKLSWNAEVFWKRAQDMYLYKRHDPSFYRNMHIGNNLGAEFTSAIRSSIGVTGFGASFRQENLTSSNLGDQDRNITTLFLDHNLSLLNNRLNITPGISWTNFSEQGNFFYPGIEVGYAINVHHKLYAHMTKVHRIPSYTELYYVSSTDQGNPDLEPESAISSELGYRWESKQWQAKLSLFQRDSEELIDWVKQNEEDKYTPENIGDVLTRGIEINLARRFNGIFKQVTLDYTYLDTEIDAYANFSRYANNNLKHQFIAKVENRLGQSFSSQIAYRFLDRVTLDNYNLLDFKLNYNQPKWKGFVSVNNVLGTDYREANLVPMPGRWFTIGASYNIPLITKSEE